jgi:hypothetical protein
MLQDNSPDTSNTMATSGGWLRISAHGASQGSATQRGRAPMLYRKVPAGGTLELSVDWSALAAAHPNSHAGIVVYDAGQNIPLFWCGVTARVGRPAQVEVESGGSTIGANVTVVNDAIGVPPVVQLRVVRNAAAQTWSCQARASSVRPWSAVTSRIDFSNAAGLPTFVEG